MQLKSPVTTLTKSAQEIFDSLAVIENFKLLMPDNLAAFEVLGKDTFRFALSGMPSITLQLAEKQAPVKLVYKAASGNIPFILTAYIEDVATTLPASKSQLYFDFKGEFSAMVAMMVKAPITNFIKTLSENAIRL